MKSALFSLFFASASSALQNPKPTVVVTGATGGTGSQIYLQLKANPLVAEVRALVMNVTTAREILGCNKCDASEGIFVGDVTKKDTLMDAFTGVDTLAIAVGTSPKLAPDVIKAVEFTGVENQVAVFATQNKDQFGLDGLRVAFMSSMGTTDPSPPPYEGGTTLFWKLNAEAALFSSGLGVVTVKPCGLKDSPGSNSSLLVGHDDAGIPSKDQVLHGISRADVAAVMVEAIMQRAGPLKFDLCAGKGAPTPPADVLKAAAMPWQQ